MLGIGVYFINNQKSGSSSNSDNSSVYSAKTSKRANSSSTVRSSVAKNNAQSMNSASSSSSSSSVDLKNLTNTQAVAWIKANMGSYLATVNTAENIEQNNGVSMTINDYMYEYAGNTGGWAGESDTSVYYDVRENHNSANMRKAGASQDVQGPIVCWFRITGAGQLQTDDPNSGWQTVSTSYNG